MTAINNFTNPGPLAYPFDGPALGGEAVTPSDSAELTQVGRALYVGAAGNVAVTTQDGSALTFVGVPAGSTLPVRAKKVLATGTTATSILNLW